MVETLIGGGSMRAANFFAGCCGLVFSTFSALTQVAFADESEPSWLGFYVGTAASYSAISNTGSDEQPSGFSGVAIVGINLIEESHFVLGIEGSAALFGVVEDGDASVGNAWSISGRVGYAIDDMLPFATLGFGRAEGEYNGESDYFDSLIVGGGLEGRLASSFNWRVEGIWSTVLEGRELGGKSIEPNAAIGRVGLIYNF